jgi:small-conductance mechanosensitive channel
LHCDIAREFKAAGIELAFPQQDIRVRTMPTDSASTIVGERRLSVLVAEPAARPEWDARAG